MTRDDEFIGDLEAYLREYEGMTPLPGSVRDAVRAGLPAIRQRSMHGGPLPTFLDVNIGVFRLGLVAAAAAIFAVIGMALLLRPTNLVGPDASSSPTPTFRSEAAALKDGPLAPGIYVAHPFEAPNHRLSFTFAVPDGWEGRLPGGVASAAGATGPVGAGVDFLQTTGVYSDSCTWDFVGIGPLAADLASALHEIYRLEQYEVNSPVDITLSGYTGKRMDLVIPAGVDFSACHNHGYPFGEDAPYAQGSGNRWHLWILDVEWERVVILAHDFATTATGDQAELLAIVESIRIEPPIIRGWPGARGAAPGRYSWVPPTTRWMHNGFQDVGDGQEMAFTFSVSADGDERGAAPVTVAGFDATYQELPSATDGSRLELWIVHIDGAKVSIALELGPKVTPAQLAAAHAIVASIQYEQVGTEPGYILTFDLPSGWDSG